MLFGLANKPALAFSFTTIDEPSSTLLGCPPPSLAELGSADTTSSEGNYLTSVPAYDWYHGCGPTAAASVIGYWDLNGYVNLFDASGDEVFLTSNVADQISSPEHNAKYNPTPDNPLLPIPASTSIADWFGTSKDPLNYGWSYLSQADNAFTGYTNYRGYQFNSWNESFSTGEFTWEDLVLEIDSQRPLMFLVDSRGDGYTDHFVPVLGYDDRGVEGKYYGFYTTWSENETIVWREFQGMSQGQPWGVGYGTFVQPVSRATPEPSPILSLLALAGLGVGLTRGRQQS